MVRKPAWLLPWQGGSPAGTVVKQVSEDVVAQLLMAIAASKEMVQSSGKGSPRREIPARQGKGRKLLAEWGPAVDGLRQMPPLTQ